MAIFNDDPTGFGPGPSGNVVPESPFFAEIDPNRQGSQGDVHWKIETIEPSGLKFQNFTVTGQFPVKEEGIKISVNQNIAEAATYGVPHPFIQWIRGELNIITFDVVLFSRDENENILPMWQRMLRLQQYVPELNRIPICRFVYGNIISMKVQVAGFGDVQIYRPKTSGTARRIEFPLTLKRFVPYKIQEIDRNKPPKFSRKQMVSGENRMYEQLARKEYGQESAMLGVSLRKLNRAFPFAAEDGGVVRIPRIDKIARDRAEPEFHGFNIKDEEVSNMFVKRLEKRKNLFLVV
jgi:hypothetical protein